MEMLNPTNISFDLPEGASAAGRGELDFEKVGNRTVLRRSYAKAPLRVLTPQNHGDASWVYTSNFGGGLVDGDQIDLRLRVRSEAKAVLLTQASTKVYRAPRGASQKLHALVEGDASLLILPDPLVCFTGSKFLQRQQIDLEARASLLLVDTVSSGRHASGERWMFDRLKNQILVNRDGKPIFFESLLLDSKIGSIGERMGRFNAFCVVLLAGPEFQEAGKIIVNSIGSQSMRSRADLISAVSPLGSDATILRMAAVSGEALGLALREALQFLPGYLGDSPWDRKW